MKVGALVIGQTPRPDLEAVLGIPDVDIRGALDLPGALAFLDDAENGGADSDQSETAPPLPTAPPPHAVFPLRTRLKDGRAVVVDEPWLAPRLQHQIGRLEEDRAQAIILLCAGPFAGLTSSVPLIRPFALGCSVFSAMGFRRLLALVPIEEQVEPARRKWEAAGFDTTAAVFPDTGLPKFTAGLARDVDAVVLDYVGLDRHLISATRKRAQIPVVDLGHLAAAALQSMMQT